MDTSGYLWIYAKNKIITEFKTIGLVWTEVCYALWDTAFLVGVFKNAEFIGDYFECLICKKTTIQMPCTSFWVFIFFVLEPFIHFYLLLYSLSQSDTVL